MKYKIKQTLVTQNNQKNILGVFDLTYHAQNLTKDLTFFEEWLQNSKHAGMKFLENNLHVRQDPSHILPNAKTAIIFLFPYSHGLKVRGKTIENPDSKEGSLFEQKLISRYVYSKDYHKIIKKSLTEWAESLKMTLNTEFNYRPVVDSIPFFERAYGRESGLGFIGKNTLLIRPGIGSFFFIGTLLLDLDISQIAEEELKRNPIFSLDCGQCNRCVEACPTNAIEKNKTLNANICLSYLTIEHRDIIDNKFLSSLNKTIYGCDICQEVCPYNFITQDVEMLSEFKAINPALLLTTPEDIALMDEKNYQNWFGGTAMTRAKYEGLVRNSLYYLHTTNSANLTNILERLKTSKYPLIKKTVDQLENLRAEYDRTKSSRNSS